MNPITSVDSNRVALHLADRALTPIFSSADIDLTAHNRGKNVDFTQASSLSSLTSVALTAYDVLLRFGAGMPLSILVETTPSGPMLISSYLNPNNVYKHDDDQKNSQPLKISKNEDKILELPQKSQKSPPSNEIKDINTADKEKTIKTPNKTDIELDYNPSLLPPLLVATVVARSSIDAAEANKRLKNLAKVGRECQKVWIKEHNEQIR